MQAGRPHVQNHVILNANSTKSEAAYSFQPRQAANLSNFQQCLAVGVKDAIHNIG